MAPKWTQFEQALLAHLEPWVDALLAQPVSGTGDARIENRLARQRPHLHTLRARALHRPAGGV